MFHIERFRTLDPRRQAVVLGVFDRLGLVKAPDVQAEWAISPVGLISFTDANAVELLRVYAWWLSFCAIGMALFAEKQQEPTLFLSLGSMGACFAVLFVGGAVAGVLVIVGCGVAFAWLRSHRSQTAFHSSRYLP